MNRARAMLVPCGLAIAAPALAQAPEGMPRAVTLLKEVQESYGVSGDEHRVRELVLRQLPSWAKPAVDTAGNVWVRVGQGGAPVVFIAHMDELGFRVDSIRPDGSLALVARGGFFTWLWEASPALVHAARAPVPGVFAPRDSVSRQPARAVPAGLRVDVGTASRAETEALGVKVGDYVTNPKRFVRLAGTKATGRSFDDRVGSTAQLLALRDLDRTRLKHEVLFIWSVREETGLEGAIVAARELGTRPARVHAIDTFVSADSPVDPQNYAVAPLGHGPVIRATDNGAVTPPPLVDSLRQLAKKHGIPVQYGTTGGSNDGAPFTAYGVPNVAIGWPLRYSHSPAETIDLRDVVALADLIRAVAEDW